MTSLALFALAFQAMGALANPVAAADSVASNSVRCAPTATIDSGVVVGTTTTIPDAGDVVVNKFLGIPFAEKPERFSPPVPVEPWSEKRSAKAFGPSCMQKFNYPLEAREFSMRLFNYPPPPVGDDEDCLQINVWSPADAPEGEADSRPVMVWIFGGGYGFGTGTLPLYESAGFAANQDLVIVTFNYRTNVLGFPGSPQIPEEEQNLAFLDQRLALDWVQRNIAAFGGDPDRVTIFGESAGGSSVDALISAPPDPLPFRAAIMQSGQAAITTNYNSTASWGTLVTEADCADAEDELACIRALPASELMSIVEQNRLAFGPVKDGGVTYVDTPRKDRSESTEGSSAIARVPIMVGHTADEGSYLIFDYTLREVVIALSGGSADEELIQLINQTYAINPPFIVDEAHQVKRMLADILMDCTTAEYIKATQDVGIDSWRYYYNGSFPNMEFFTDMGIKLDAYHSSDIASIFGTFPDEGSTELQRETSAVMQKAWGDFAKNPSQGPGWEQAVEVGIFGGSTAKPNDPFVVGQAAPMDQRCALWKPLYEAIGDGGIPGIA